MSKFLEPLYAVIQYCYERQLWEDLVEIILSIKSYWTTRGYFEIRNRFLGLAIEAVGYLRDNKTLVWLLAIKTRTLCYLGDIDGAVACLNQARSLVAEMPDPPPSLVENLNEAHIRVCFCLGDIEQQFLLARANVASAGTRDKPAELLYRYYIADSHFLAGDYQEAEALFLTLIKESAEQEFHRAMITGWLSLAQIALQRGEFAEVVVRLQKADVLAQEFKHRRYVGEIHHVWSQVHALRGELPAARASLSEAIDLFERLGMRRELAQAREELRRLEEMGEAPAA